MPIKILIVDDSPEMLAVLALQYESHPEIQVTGIADNTAGALKMLEFFSFDLVSLDIHLGRDNGIELCKAVKSAFPKVYVTMCSLEDSDIIQRQAKNSGAQYFLSKPFTMNDVFTLVSAYTEWKSSGTMQAEDQSGDTNAGM